MASSVHSRGVLQAARAISNIMTNDKESHLIWEAFTSSNKVRAMQDAVHDFMTTYDLVRRHPELVEDGQFTAVFREHKEELRVASNRLGGG